MKTFIVTNASELLKHINFVSGIVSKKSTLPISTNIHLSIEGDRMLCIRGTDLEHGVLSKIKIETIESLYVNICIDPKPLKDVLKNAGKEPLCVKIEDTINDDDTLSKKNRTQVLTIIVKGKAFKLPCMDGTDFPVLPLKPLDDIKYVMSMDLRKVLPALNKGLHAVSKDDFSRYPMQGIHFNFKPDSSHIAGTDAHRLVLYKYAEANKQTVAFTIPTAVVKLIQSIPKITTANTITVNVSENRIELVVDTIIINCRLLSSSFPEYERIIPNNYTKSVTINTKEFKDSLKKIAAYFSKDLYVIHLKLKDNLLTVNNQAGNVVETSETITCPYTGDEFTVSFNNKFLLELINSIDTEELVMTFDAPIKAVLFEPVVSDPLLKITYLLMPIYA